MSSSCPLNFVKVDSNVSRFAALFVALLVITYLYTGSVYILLYLAVDFVLKLFLNPGISPILDIWLLSLSIAFIFLSCSLLDVFFDFCIGCKIYYIIKKVYPNFMNNL